MMPFVKQIETPLRLLIDLADKGNTIIDIFDAFILKKIIIG